MKTGKLVANNGAAFSWDDTNQSGKRYFEFNEIAYKEALNGKIWTNAIKYSDCSEIEAWGTSNDFSPIHDTILYNVAYFIERYPETGEQFIKYLIDNKTETDGK